MTETENLSHFIQLQIKAARNSQRQALEAGIVVEYWCDWFHADNKLIRAFLSPLVVLRLIQFPETARRTELMAGFEATFRQRLAELLAEGDEQALRVVHLFNQQLS